MEKAGLKRNLLALFFVAIAYLLAWPVSIDPRPWDPPVAPSVEQGIYARNDKLRGVQRIADGAVAGPEAIAIDATGRLYSGLEDGRVVSMRLCGARRRVWWSVRTGAGSS